ncbi:MAG: Yip1 family protein [Anaerolineae bacterium]
MQTIASFFRPLIGALLLRDEAYADMRDDPSPFIKGLGLIVVVAVLFSLVGIVGDTLEWATTPNMDRLKEAVWEGMQDGPWFQGIPPDQRAEVLGIVRQQYNLGWQIAKGFAPSPLNAAVGVITNPFSLVVVWLVYGFLAHIFAKLLGGTGNLTQTYGTTALAVSPQLLNLVTILPYAEVGGVTGVWSLACNYLALKNAHRLTPARAFWATILPFVTLLVVAILLGILGVAVISALIQGGR